MKKISFGLFVLMGFFFIIFYFGKKENEVISKTSILKDATDNNKLHSQHKLPAVINKNIDLNSPASKQEKPINQDLTKNCPKREGRILIGHDVEKYQQTSVPLKMKNKINPEWKNNLKNNLYKFMPEGTEANFILERSYIKVEKGQGRYLEQVQVTYKMPSGQISSFNAEVDPQNGKMTSTWNRTIIESAKAEVLRYEASGAIYKGL